MRDELSARRRPAPGLPRAPPRSRPAPATGLELEAERIRLGAGQEQQVVDQPAHLLGLLDDARQGLAIVLRPGLARLRSVTSASPRRTVKGVRSSWLTSARNRTRSRSRSFEPAVGLSSCRRALADLALQRPAARAGLGAAPRAARPCWLKWPESSASSSRPSTAIRWASRPPPMALAPSIRRPIGRARARSQHHHGHEAGTAARRVTATTTIELSSRASAAVW